MRKLYFTPYGVGLGHASRLLVLANKFKEYGCESNFSSFGEVKNYLNIHGYECNVIPPVEFLWGKDGGFSVKDNITKIPRWVTNVPIQINMEIGYLKRFKPNIIISDSRISSLIAGKILNIPTILLINQIKLLLTPTLRKFQIVKFFETCFGEFMGGMWNISDKILIPDLPPPYTISEDTINSVRSIKPKLNYIGFLTSKKLISHENLNSVAKILQIDKNRFLIFIHISGPKETRIPIILKLLEVCKTMPNIQFVISEGKANGKTNPNKIGNNIWYFEWCPYRDEIFHLSNMLIIRGGHTAISQAIQFGKPFLSIPIENHGEQLSNSNKIEKLGIGLTINPTLINTAIIKQTIENILYDNKYTKKALQLMETSNKLDGIENIKDIVFSQI
ncbi:MAG TPA: glycosyltransferase family protein [Verrucomicrobiae bacterium]|nr:glycosyltransferase family protein [Verrucomicrobiae bacterium]